MKSPSMPDWRTLHLQRYERCRGGKCDEERRKGLTNATRRCVCCMRVSVCVCIYNKAKQRTGRKAEGWGDREGGRVEAMRAEPAAVAAVVDCQIHVAFHAFQLSCS